MQREKKQTKMQSVETDPEGAQMLYFVVKDFKSAIRNMSEE